MTEEFLLHQYLNTYREGESWDEYQVEALEQYRNALFHCLQLSAPANSWRIADITANSATQITNFAQHLGINQSDLDAEIFIFDGAYSVGDKSSPLHKSATRTVQTSYIPNRHRINVHNPVSRYAHELNLSDLGGEPVHCLVDLKGATWFEARRLNGDPIGLLKQLSNLTTVGGGILLDGHLSYSISSLGRLVYDCGESFVTSELRDIGLAINPFGFNHTKYTFLQKIG